MDGQNLFLETKSARLKMANQEETRRGFVRTDTHVPRPFPLCGGSEVVLRGCGVSDVFCVRTYVGKERVVTETLVMPLFYL
jgi:hypothetical protein